MSKLIGEPVKAHQKDDGDLGAFIWRRRLYYVESVLGWWREPDEWWHGRVMRLFVRVNASSRNNGSGTYELYQLGDEWFLERVID